MRRNRVILQLRAEFISYLLVNGIDDFLAGKHGRPFSTVLCLTPAKQDIQSPMNRRRSTAKGNSKAKKRVAIDSLRGKDKHLDLMNALMATRRNDRQQERNYQ